MTGQRPVTAPRPAVWSAATVTTGSTPPPQVRTAQLPSPLTGISPPLLPPAVRAGVGRLIGPAAAGRARGGVTRAAREWRRVIGAILRGDGPEATGGPPGRGSRAGWRSVLDPEPVGRGGF